MHFFGYPAFLQAQKVIWPPPHRAGIDADGVFKDLAPRETFTLLSAAE